MSNDNLINQKDKAVPTENESERQGERIVNEIKEDLEGLCFRWALLERCEEFLNGRVSALNSLKSELIVEPSCLGNNMYKGYG